jgi:hypothetical protein
MGATADPFCRMREPPHDHRRSGPRFELRHDLLDPALGLVGRPLEENRSILGSEDRGQQRDPAQVDPSVPQHLQEPGVLPAGPGHVDAQAGLGLREVEHLHAVGEHRRHGLPGVGPPGVDLGDVGDEVGLDPPRVLEQRGETTQKLVVRD